MNCRRLTPSEDVPFFFNSSSSVVVILDQS